MSHVENRTCPKCRGQMIEAHRLVAHTRLLAGISLAKKGDILGDQIFPFYCKNCGYIELYKGKTQEEGAFLKKCANCQEEIPIASEECPHCNAQQPKYVDE